MYGSAASHASSGCHGSWISESASGIANTSGSAGVRSRWVAKPAKVAPSRCIGPMAAAGTSLARSPPNRSTKLIRKYWIFLSRAIFARSFAIARLLAPARDPVGAGERHARHRGGLDGECRQVLGLEVEQMRLAARARQGLGLERQGGEIVA